MKELKKEIIVRRLLLFESLGFVLLIINAWLNEYVHMRGYIWDAPPRTIEWQEALFESCIIGVVAFFVLRATKRLLRRLAQLEGILPICSSCKSIQGSDGDWQKVEEYVHDHSEVDFSHGLCPTCAKEWAKSADLGMDTHFFRKR